MLHPLMLHPPVSHTGEEEDVWPKKGMREKLSQRLAASDSRGSTDETGGPAAPAAAGAQVPSSSSQHQQQGHHHHVDRTWTPPLPPHHQAGHWHWWGVGVSV